MINTSDIAQRDENRNVTIQGVSGVDFLTPTNVAVNPNSKALLVESTKVLPNKGDFDTNTITITSAGTAQQGPSMPVSDGFSLVVKGRDGNVGNIFFARSQLNAQSSGKRITVAPGSAARLFITNANLAWFDAVNSNDIVELFAEKGN